MAKYKTESGQRECPAEAFLNMAQQYHLAATTLFPLRRRAEMPLYFLYTHTIELALKAYLRSHGCRVPYSHKLPWLFQQCADQGLRGHSDLRNVIQLLESENKEYGFRYFVFATTGKPEITYLREVVDDLMAVVVEEVKKRPSTDLPKKAVLKMTVSRPYKK
jgi:HEPN domain-containing protein